MYNGSISLTTDLTVKQAQKLWGTLLDYRTTKPLEADTMITNVLYPSKGK